MLTIVTPAYNAMPYIKACHDSIRSQTYSAWRWIVVDDASTDGTAEYLDSIAETDNRITVSHRTENSGNAKLPRDTGVTMAETERVMLIDADDTISPDYVSTMMETMDRMESDIVYPRMHFMDQQGRVRGTLPDIHLDNRLYTGKETVMMTIPSWHIGCNGGLYRKPILQAVIKSSRQCLMNTDEVDERRCMLLTDRIAFARTSYFYRCPPTSITSSKGRKQLDTLRTDRQLHRLIISHYGIMSRASMLMIIRRIATLKAIIGMVVRTWKERGDRKK